MSAVREPLPYDHSQFGASRSATAACALSEGVDAHLNVLFGDCPGCTAAMLALALHDPQDWIEGEDGEYRTAVENARWVLEEVDDPALVLFERALAERHPDLVAPR